MQRFFLSYIRVIWVFLTCCLELFLEIGVTWNRTSWIQLKDRKLFKTCKNEVWSSGLTYARQITYKTNKIKEWYYKKRKLKESLLQLLNYIKLSTFYFFQLLIITIEVIKSYISYIGFNFKYRYLYFEKKQRFNWAIDPDWTYIIFLNSTMEQCASDEWFEFRSA